MAIRFADSAFRHEINPDRIIFVIQNCASRIDIPDDDDLVMFLGDDWHGVPLEVGAFEWDNGDLLVVHAMKLRRKYRREYEAGL